MKAAAGTAPRARAGLRQPHHEAPSSGQCWHQLPGSQLDATDVSCMAGHANVRTTLDIYIGTTVGVLDRARTATA